MEHFFISVVTVRSRKNSLAGWSKTTAFGSLLLLLATTAFSQDPGIPDSVRIEADSLIIGQSRPIIVTFANDDLIRSMTLPLIIASMNSGFAIFDSVVFVGRMADPSVLELRIVHPREVNGISQDSIQISGYYLTSNMLAPGNSAVAEIYFTGLTPGLMKVDSAQQGIGGFPVPISLVIQGPTPFEYTLAYPVFSTEVIPIVEGAALPTITLSGEQVQDAAGSNVTFEVAAASPVGYPVNVSLLSFNEYDHPANGPANAPTLNYNSGGNFYQFSWNSTGSDVGIWKAIVRACDSAGNCVSKEATVQIVEDAGYIVGLETTQSPGFSYPTSIGIGNFDDDLHPEIATTGLGLFSTPIFALFDNDGSGTFGLTFFDNHPDLPRRGIQVGYLDEDDNLDLVQFMHPDLLKILVYHGDGGNSFATPDSTLSSATNWGLAATLGNYNNDAYLDYAIAGLNFIRIFAGSANSEFALLNQFNVGDSIMTLVSKDLNNDGYDDFVAGHKGGIKIFLCSAAGALTYVTSYVQTFGTVNIEVTNQGADFNGDDYFDLCVATPSIGNATSELMVYLGNGDGTFQQRIARNIYGQIVANAPGDFNNDGLVDIAFLNSSRRYLGILFGDGDGNFTNELRYSVPIFSPARLVCTDADLDGDADVIVNSSKIPGGSYLILYENQSNPPDFTSMPVDFSGEDNAQLELVSPSQRVLNRIGNSMPSAGYFRRNLNLNDKLDDFANMNLVENGEYVLTVRPDPSQPAGTPFTVEFTADGLPLRLAKNAVMSSAGYDFAVSLAGGVMMAPRSGSFIIINPPVFVWPNKANVDFQLASDLDFNSIIIDSNITSSIFQPANALSIGDTTAFYWRIKPAGSVNYGPIYAFNLVASSPGCGDVDGQAGSINILDLNFLVNLIFRGGAAPPNFENADLNNDGKINILDLNFLVNYIFRGGLPPVC